MFALWKKKKDPPSPRMRLLELTVATRYAASRIGLLINRVRTTYMRTRDENLLKLLRNMVYIQSVLEILSLRLETLASIGIVSSTTLQLVREVLSKLRNEYTGLQPMIDSILLELENMASTIAAESGIEPPATPIHQQYSLELKEILERAQIIASERTREMLA